MAKEQALRFIARVNEDTALRDKLQAVSKEGIDGLVRVGNEDAFDFSKEEFEAVVLEQWGWHRPGEVSNGELDGIAGGGTYIMKIGIDQKFFIQAARLCVGGKEKKI